MERSKVKRDAIRTERAEAARDLRDKGELRPEPPPLRRGSSVDDEEEPLAIILRVLAWC